RNTRQFLAGFPANHALLWGPRGTGKSSLVKALIHEYADLCFVEVEREALVDLFPIFETLHGRPERFILYCDDLSFELHDPSCRALKIALDGSLGCAPENVLVYATSNRRHLVPERMEDNLAGHREDGELHPGEAVEERISLSERFGLWLAFHPLRQDEYLEIVSHWIGRLGVSEGDPSAMRGEALRWALAHGSRSGRSAFQFARDRVGQERLRRQGPE
ncbi:MAG: ATP-binding protein, partial [Gammaproteobacteria bacterium]